MWSPTLGLVCKTFPLHSLARDAVCHMTQVAQADTPQQTRDSPLRNHLRGKRKNCTQARCFDRNE